MGMRSSSVASGSWSRSGSRNGSRNGSHQVRRTANRQACEPMVGEQLFQRVSGEWCSIEAAFHLQHCEAEIWAAWCGREYPTRSP